MSTSIIRNAATQLTAAANYADDPKTDNLKFNWQSLISLLVQVIPAILALFTKPAPPVQ